MNIKEQIAQYQGLTSESVLNIAAAILLQDMKKGKPLTSPAQTIKFLQTALAGRKNECFLVVYMDTRHRVIDAIEEFKGTIDGACVYPRVIAERALI